jgi:hypothetical protein
LQAQIKFSAATDISLLHNFESTQKFSVVGLTLIPQWHLDKTTVYAWLSYANGKYKTDLTATAKSSTTQPQTIFVNESETRLRQVSIGIKQYLIGSYESLKASVYGGGGFGLIHGRVFNTFSTAIDTSLILYK